MENLIDFAADAAEVMVAVLAVIGFLALVAGLAVILHMDTKDMWEDEEDGK